MELESWKRRGEVAEREVLGSVTCITCSCEISLWPFLLFHRRLQGENKVWIGLWSSCHELRVNNLCHCVELHRKVSDFRSWCRVERGWVTRDPCRIGGGSLTSGKHAGGAGACAASSVPVTMIRVTLSVRQTLQRCDCTVRRGWTT